MKKLIIAILTLAICASMAVPALAYNYDFGSGPDSGATFGGSTSTDEPVVYDNLKTSQKAAEI
jgi:hypothetical protein